ncbi:MAG: AAA family ATPase [Cyanobacteria bacterium SBC]|nr:AAA family ATPase [Cyanobacteria bacterium SBC]
MKVITFYSYKGGVGRTLAAANFAVYLAKLGLKIVVVDFDLEAPGIDAKFGMSPLAEHQQGLLDYILEFQEYNRDPGSLDKICIPVVSEELEGLQENLWLIPAGQYLSQDYNRKLSQLSWGKIFSEQRNGVEFFQNLLYRLENEIQADFVLIDSRTGITEISGLCTQQLSSEVVMLSSLSRESQQATKHIKNLIETSSIAKALEKQIQVKLVISRFPKPENLNQYKKQLCRQFEISEDRLFFLFSCPELETEEFLAVQDTLKSEELTDNYAKLFYGLDIDLANQSIQSEISKASSKLLINPEEAEKEIINLVALYPHPDVYKAAMSLCKLTGKIGDTIAYAFKVLDLAANDREAQRIIAEHFLSISSSQFGYTDKEKIIQIIDTAFEQRRLSLKEQISFARLLFKLDNHEKCYAVSQKIYNTDDFKQNFDLELVSIAADSAFRLKKHEDVKTWLSLISHDSIIKSNLEMIALAVWKDEFPEKAFSIAMEALKRDALQNEVNPTLVKNIFQISEKNELLGKTEREDELKALLQSLPFSDRQKLVQDPYIKERFRNLVILFDNILVDDIPF